MIVNDNLGNSTAPISDALRGRVPEVDTYTLGDHVEMIVMPTNKTYTVTFQTIDIPPAIKLTAGASHTTTQAIRYLDLTLPVSVTAVLTFTPQGVGILHYDRDADGTFETPITPTVAVSGTLAQDTVPPMITISTTNDHLCHVNG